MTAQTAHWSGSTLSVWESWFLQRVNGIVPSVPRDTDYSQVFHQVNDDITIYAEMKPVIAQQNC